MAEIELPTAEAFLKMSQEERRALIESVPEAGREAFRRRCVEAIGALGELPEMPRSGVGYPRPEDAVAASRRECSVMIDAYVRYAAQHFQERRSWRVRLSRRLRWWAIRLGRLPVPQTSLMPRQIAKLPFFEGLAIAMVITDLVIREELVIWLNKKQPRAKRISVGIDDWIG